MPLASSGIALAALALSGSSISLHAGAYRVIDRADARYDGPELALRGHVPLETRGGAVEWGLVLEAGAAGELAGGRGSCLGELTARVGPALAVAARPRWLRFEASAGPGVAFARLYGSLLDRNDPEMTASGDRVLPQAWASLGASVELLPSWTLSIAALARFVPSTVFHADRVPAGASSDFYPVFRRSHDLSTIGASLGVAHRF